MDYLFQLLQKIIHFFEFLLFYCQNSIKFYPVLFSHTFKILDKLFVTIRTTYNRMCGDLLTKWGGGGGGGGRGFPNVVYMGMCHRSGSISHIQKSITGREF